MPRLTQQASENSRPELGHNRVTLLPFQNNQSRSEACVAIAHSWSTVEGGDLSNPPSQQSNCTSCEISIYDKNPMPGHKCTACFFARQLGGGGLKNPDYSVSETLFPVVLKRVRPHKRQLGHLFGASRGPRHPVACN
jgi:hypothetical protein